MNARWREVVCKEEGGEGRDSGSGIICECGEGLLSISRLDGQLRCCVSLLLHITKDL